MKPEGYPLPWCDDLDVAHWQINLCWCCNIEWGKWQAYKPMSEIIPVIDWLFDHHLKRSEKETCNENP